MATRHEHKRAGRVLGSVGVFAAVLLLSGLAAASPNFPDVLQKVSGSPCAPSCLLCHSTNPGRLGTAAATAATRPFTNALVLNGAVAASGGKPDSEIRAVFLKMRDGVDTNGDGAIDTPPTNSDGDALTDFEELNVGINPNPGDAALCDVTYGCGARVAPTPPSRLALFSSVLVAGCLLLAGSRARRSKP